MIHPSSKIESRCKILLNLFYTHAQQKFDNLLAHFEKLYKLRCLVDLANYQTFEDTKILNETKLQFLKSIDSKEMKYFETNNFEGFKNSTNLQECLAFLSMIIDSEPRQIKRFKNAQRNWILLVIANSLLVISIILMFSLFLAPWLKIQLFSTNVDSSFNFALTFFDQRLVASEFCAHFRNSVQDLNSFAGIFMETCEIRQDRLHKLAIILFQLTGFFMFITVISHPVALLSKPNNKVLDSHITQGPDEVTVNLMESKEGHTDNGDSWKPLGIRPNNLIVLGNGYCCCLASLLLMGNLICFYVYFKSGEFVMNVNHDQVILETYLGSAFYLGIVTAVLLRVGF